MSVKGNKIAVIGGGSWGTALLKILEQNGHHINWWVRKEDMAREIIENGRNPRYLSSVEINREHVSVSTNIREVVRNSDMILFCVPSFFFKDAIRDLKAEDLKGKIIISAIKGIVPEEKQLISTYLFEKFGIPGDHFVNISGPSHAEEVAFGRITYLTFASENTTVAGEVASHFKTPSLYISTSPDVYGLEYAAVFKNIYAIAGGISNSLGYGDNFQAVLVSAAIREIKLFLDVAAPGERNILDNGYLGDLLVTAYSQFSRNRTFGNMLGKGYSARSALMEMNMVPEGYYAVEPAYEMLIKYDLKAPVAKAVYHIIHDKISPMVEFRILSGELIH